MTTASTPDRRFVLRAAADAYFNGLAKKDISGVPYAEDVTFRTPLSDAVIAGKQNVCAFFAGIYAALGEITIGEHFTNDELTAICVEAEVGLANGRSLRVVDVFRIDASGRVVAQENHYDPRPALT